MLKNYLTIAFRNIIRRKGFSFINIAGLAVGLAVSMLIFLWVQDEYNYDSFNEKADSIYRVVFSYQSNDRRMQHWRTPPPMAAAIREKYPEISDAARFHNEGMVLLIVGDKKLKVRAGYTDNNLFNIFTLPFLQGSSEEALLEPNSAVISKKMAEIFFTDENPIGKIININNQFELTVDGVLKELPANSHLQFDFLMQFSRLPEVMGYGEEEDWGDFGFNTFILLNEQTNIAQVEENINSCIDEVLPEIGRKFYLKSLTDIHLYNLDGSPGMMTYVYIFSSIAIFIIIIACINFMNLCTARSSQRTKEIGIRKVVGAVRNQLRLQFMGESLLLSFIALIFALVIVELLLPMFNELTDKQLNFNMLNMNILYFILGITFITGLISGIYPALLLSSFKPISVIKRDKTQGSSLFRKILVIVQFTLSIMLIFSTIVVSKQMVFIRNRNLGFNKENIVYLPLNNSYCEKSDAFKEELLRDPNVLNVTRTSNKTGISPKWSMGVRQWEGNAGEEEIDLPLISCDMDYLKTFGLELVAGEFYKKNSYSDEEEFEFVVNETTIKKIGMEKPIGKSFANGRIIGVVKDFNYRSLHSKIGLLALVAIPEWDNYIAIKIRSENIQQTLDFIEKVSSEIAPDFPFEFHFLESDFDELYGDEIRLGKLFNCFSFLAIIISCLGLLGLASFSTQQRIKEIGIRKVLGSSVAQVVILLSTDFTKWIFIANLIALPVAYYLMNNWLHNFAFKTNINLWIFLISGGVALFVAFFTISFQTIKVANANPIDALKYE